MVRRRVTSSPPQGRHIFSPYRCQHLPFCPPRSESICWPPCNAFTSYVNRVWHEGCVVCLSTEFVTVVLRTFMEWLPIGRNSHFCITHFCSSLDGSWRTWRQGDIIIVTLYIFPKTVRTQSAMVSIGGAPLFACVSGYGRCNHFLAITLLLSLPCLFQTFRQAHLTYFILLRCSSFKHLSCTSLSV